MKMLCMLLLGFSLLGAELVDGQVQNPAFGNSTMIGIGGRRRGWDNTPAKAPAQAVPLVKPASKGVTHAPPEVDKDEVIRRGNLEEYVDGESRFSNEYGDHIAQIAATPANDNDKWFISVIGKKSCPACDSLHAAWYGNDETLRAYAKPNLPRDSWAHFTWYDYGDKYQSWRWTKSPQNPNPIEITAFPTVVVQPPRSKAYGDPQTVVLKYVWEGDSQKLAQAINGSIRAYVDTLHKAHELQKLEPEKQSAVAGGGFRSLEAEEYCQLDPRNLVAEAPTGFKGIGQQQVPPLVLPNDPPADRPLNPRQEARLMGAKPHILIVTDEDLVQSQEQDDVIKTTVAAIQPPVPVKVYQKSFKDVPKNLGVKAEEVPVVLLVEGNDIVEKRQVPRVNAEFGGPFLAIWSGLGSLISFFVWFVSSICSMLVLLFIAVVSAKTLQHFEILPKPLWGGAKATPAPAPTDTTAAK